MRRGVTLVELAFVVAFFLVLSAILTPVVRFTNDRSGAIRCADNLRQISLALHAYAADHNDAFPQSLGQLYPGYIKEQKAFDCPASASLGTQDKPDYEYVAGLTELSPQTEVIVYDRDAHHRGSRKHLLRIDGSVELVKSDGKPR
ncbi:MAG: type II secretion system protein [Candidatus Omnitrophica bacterium]|nr:type II secretion system protein [Candidatus Omnitrophota bacterium]